MNDRIRQLAKEAGYEEDMFGVGHWDMPEFQKFVKLMIDEFASMFPGTFTDERYQRRIDKTIRKHFGLEE
jgi:hypothetical protein